jgi:hypothetical protein
MIRTGYPFGMSTTPSDPAYPNPERLGRFMRAFDTALLGWARTHLERAQLATTAKQQMEDLEVIKQQSIHEEPTITYIPRQKEPPRELGWFDRLRYDKDSIRLRKYNDEWIKNNILE